MHSYLKRWASSLTIGFSAWIAVGCSSEPVANPVVVGINFVGYAVSDLSDTIDMYSEAAALQPAAESIQITADEFKAFNADIDLSAKSQLMKSINGQVLFMQFDQATNAAKASPKIEVYGPGFAHICYQVAEATKTYQRFLDQGATAIGDPEMQQLNPRNPVKYAYARDLDEVMIEVEHVDLTQLDLSNIPKHKHRMRHIALATPDINELVDFYSILLEIPKPRRLGRWFPLSGEKLDAVSGEKESKIKMAFFPVRNMELEIAQYVSHPTERLSKFRPIDALGYNMIVFEVSSLTKAQTLLTKAGGTIVSSTANFLGVPTVFARDVDGNLLGLQEIDASKITSSQNFENDGT